MKRILCLSSALAILLCGSIAIPLQAEPVRGAIFTTLGDGSAVNANQFESKCAVHLDGGPGPNAPAGAAGLADGDYYFQVTDPSGKQLLSTDPVSNRRFKVSGGVIVAYTGFGGPVHSIGVDNDHSELGAITIRLANETCEADFLDSPNAGGAYKVWATPVGDFAGNPANVDNACGNGCYHGFMPAKSKTDNFKAKNGTETFCLTIIKELQNESGVFERKAGWPMIVVAHDLNGMANWHYTGENGEVKVCALTAGLYTVQEDAADEYPHFLVAALFVDGQEIRPAESIYSFRWSAGMPGRVILFKNFPTGGSGGL